MNEIAAERFYYQDCILRVRVFQSEAPAQKIIFLHIPQDEQQEFLSSLGEVFAALVLVDGVNWNRDFSPWPAPAVFAGGEAFAGGAQEYLHFFSARILPFSVQHLPAGLPLAIAGYSMAGLFALWAALNDDSFSEVGCFSGSLWYDGFERFAADAQGLALKRAYFSLGEKESLAKNPRLARVGQAMNDVCARFHAHGLETRFDRWPGGHFTDIAGRTAAGVRWLSGGG